MWFFVAFDTVLSFALSFVAKEPFPLIKDIASAFFIIGGTLKNSPIWFLLVLFLCNVLHTITGKIKFFNYVVLIVCFVISCFELYFGNGMCWYMAFFACMFFYEIGYLFKGKIITVNKTVLIIATVLMFVAWIGLSIYNGIVDIIWIKYGKSFILLVITALLGINLLFIFSKTIERFSFSKIFVLFGRESMIILVTHYYFTKYIIPKVFYMLGIDEYLHTNIVEILLLVVFAIVYYCILFIIRHNKEKRMKILTDKS